MPTSDSQVLPLVLQHVRELAEAQLPATDHRYKIITPFPPVFNDFGDFMKDNLGFSDPEGDGEAARRDAWNAYQFFLETDGLYYDYSYGIRSPDYSLSQVCEKFVQDAVYTEPVDLSFKAAFEAQKAIFLHRFKRTTVADLGHYDFYYVAPGLIHWNSGQITVDDSNCARLKAKVLALYGGIENPGNDYLQELMGEIGAVSYAKITYDYGFFDVTRAWLDPKLFENSGWKFGTEQEALYGANDPDFQAEEVRLCFAQRYYVIKNYGGTRTESAMGAVVLNPVPSLITVRDHRVVVRDMLLKRTLTQAQQIKLISDGRAGYVWVDDHWERERANGPLPSAPLPVIEEDSIYKIAAVKCRLIPWKPVAKQ